MAVEQAHRPSRVESRSARGQERAFDADSLARSRRQGSDPAARIVSAHLVRRGDGQEAVVGRRFVVRDEVDAGHRRRHDLRQRLRRAGERSRQQSHRAVGRRGVEDGGRRRQRRALEGRVPEVHRPPSGSTSPISIPTASLDQRRVGVLSRRARLRERHARDSPRRLGRHDRQGDSLEVPAQRAAAPFAAAASGTCSTWSTTTAS